MKKTYRINVFNRTTGNREFMYERYTSKKKAQEIADKINELDKDKIINAKVISEG